MVRTLLNDDKNLSNVLNVEIGRNRFRRKVADSGVECCEVAGVWWRGRPILRT